MEECFVAGYTDMGGSEMFPRAYILHAVHLPVYVFYRGLETVVSDCTERSIDQYVGVFVDPDCWWSYSCGRRMDAAVYDRKNLGFLTKIQYLYTGYDAEHFCTEPMDREKRIRYGISGKQPAGI